MQLLIVDTVQIQPYIYGSNRLRENIGASFLVAQATTEWALKGMPEPNNVEDAAAAKWWNNKQIEHDNLEAEVLYVGGGNVVALFQGEEQAIQFTRRFSRKLLEKAPGLQLVIHHQLFEWKESLYGEVQECFKALNRKKRQRTVSTPQLGLGVTMMCSSTSMPVVAESRRIGNDEPRPISAEIKAKLWAAEPINNNPAPADERLNNYLKCPSGYEFPHDFDDMGRSDEEFSYLAIVHADGDSMGSRIRAIGKGQSNRVYIQQIREFSYALNEATRKSLQATIDDLERKLKSHGDGKLVHRSDFGDILAEVTLKEGKKEPYYLPFRPIVFGGDDVTFVCDGRLGISLALAFMRHFQEYTKELPDQKGCATASAGVVVVKSHYPFAQAYELVKGITDGAKKYRKEVYPDKVDKDKVDKGACIDWHFARSGLSGTIENIREREYEVQAGSLILRPVTVDKNSLHPQRAWQVIETGVNEFQDYLVKSEKRTKPDWSSRRNKIKALRQLLREGGTAVQQFRTKFNEGKDLPDVAPDAGMSNWPTDGWQGKQCGYFDAIELMDWFIPLEVKNEA